MINAAITTILTKKWTQLKMQITQLSQAGLNFDFPQHKRQSIEEKMLILLN